MDRQLLITLLEMKQAAYEAELVILLSKANPSDSAQISEMLEKIRKLSSQTINQLELSE